MLAVFCVYRKINPALCLVVSLDGAASQAAYNVLMSFEALQSAGYYLWFAGGCITNLCASLSCAIIAASVESRHLKKAAIAVSFIYILSAIYTLFTLIESIPVDGVYPLDFLGLYENYENAARVFIVLILLVLFLYTGSKGHGTRTTTNRINHSSSGDGVYLFNSADYHKHVDSGK